MKDLYLPVLPAQNSYFFLSSSTLSSRLAGVLKRSKLGTIRWKTVYTAAFLLPVLTEAEFPV